MSSDASASGEPLETLASVPPSGTLGVPFGDRATALVIGHAASYAFAASIRGFVLFGDDRYCVDLHERAWASVSCRGNDRDGCAVIAPH